MEIHEDIIVGKAVELRQELNKLLDEQDRFIEYMDAKCGYVYACHNIEDKEYVIFIAQETDNHRQIQGFAIYDNREQTSCPHIVNFDKRKNNTFIDLTGANPDATQDNIQDFVNTFIKETEFNG